MLEPGEARRASLERNAENRARLAFTGTTFKVPLIAGGSGPLSLAQSAEDPGEDLPVGRHDIEQLWEAYEDLDSRVASLEERLWPIEQGEAGSYIVRFETPAEFDVTFIERPFVSVGVVLDLDDLYGAYKVDDENVDARLLAPNITGFVAEWATDENGFFTGAWCAASVQMPFMGYSSSDRPIEADIDFTFRGIAMKDVDPEVRI